MESCKLCKLNPINNNYSLLLGGSVIYFCSEDCKTKAQSISRPIISRKLRDKIRTARKANSLLDENEKIKLFIENKKNEEAKNKQQPIEVKPVFKSFPYRLKVNRWLMGMTEAELGQAIGVTEFFIKLLEEGSIRPNAIQLKDLAEVFGISEGQLQPTKKD